MKKIFAILLVTVALVFAVSSVVDAKHYEQQTCYQCGGTGQCPVCSGEGSYEDRHGENIECNNCYGSGKCSVCNGDGWTY